MTRKRQMEVYLLGTTVACITLCLLIQQYWPVGGFAVPFHRIFARIQACIPESGPGQSATPMLGEHRDNSPDAGLSDEARTKELEQNLRREVAKHVEEISVVQRQIRENEVHIRLLVNRGYSDDSAAVTMRRTENGRLHNQIKGHENAVSELQRRLQEVQSALTRHEAHTTQFHSPQVDRAWYLWEQTCGRKEDSLLELRDSHARELCDVNSSPVNGTLQ